ncbi:tetratricopeptide repeat protein [Rhodococcus ruber]|uniref:Tetratricopeptide repeat protein n=1 Tax=Rhodococcus ruber TaxID=1830 RepID=A0ABT4MEN5_9NOCA|nr:tetratricopeptide repeat protein [Rhodococcus ruber]MCZ4519446.1 tetratricopeptide repeat protein [Rhodococcus ruber]
MSIANSSISATNGGVAVGAAHTVSVHLPPPSPSQVSARQILPNDHTTALFGRDTHLNEIVTPLARQIRNDMTPSVTTLTGLAGVGKTQLAVHASKQLLSQSSYDAAVFVDLNGYSETEAASAENAYPSILRVLSVLSPKSGEIPPGADMQTEYHLRLQQLAQSDTAILLVFDNVSMAMQIEDLVPTNGFHHVLVTTRDTLNALPRTRAVAVDTLAPTDAAHLVTSVIDARVPGDRRTADNPRALAELCALSGYLPLALHIVGALVGDEPRRSLEDLTAELRIENTRLAAFEYEHVSVRAAFELSYRRLSSRLRRLFRSLPRIPGPDFGLMSAGAAGNQPTSATRREISALVRAHLVERPRAERWRMHDLIRLYSNELAAKDIDERKSVDSRIAQTVALRLAAAEFAVVLQSPTPAQLRAFGFGDRAEAETWLYEDRFAITGVIERCVQSGDPMARTLTKGASDIFETMHMTSEWVAACTLWVQCAETGSDEDDLNIALNQLGASLRAVRRFDDATSVHNRSLQLYRSRGDRRGQGAALVNIANVLQDQRRYPEAIELYHQDIVLCRDAGDSESEADTQGNLAAVLIQAGRTDQAVAHIERAEQLYRDADAPAGIARALDLRGVILQLNGRYEDASSLHREAAARYERLGDAHRQSGAINNALVAEQMFGDPQVAIEHHLGEVTRMRRLGDLQREATALTNLSLAQDRSGLCADALRNLNFAAELYAKCNDAYGEAKSYFLSGLTSTKLGEQENARTLLSRAEVLFGTLLHCAHESAEARHAIRELNRTL